MASWDLLARAELEKQMELLSCFTGRIHGKLFGSSPELLEAKSTKLKRPETGYMC